MTTIFNAENNANKQTFRAVGYSGQSVVYPIPRLDSPPPNRKCMAWIFVLQIVSIKNAFFGIFSWWTHNDELRKIQISVCLCSLHPNEWNPFMANLLISQPNSIKQCNQVKWGIKIGMCFKLNCRFKPTINQHHGNFSGWLIGCGWLLGNALRLTPEPCGGRVRGLYLHHQRSKNSWTGKAHAITELKD